MSKNSLIHTRRSFLKGAGVAGLASTMMAGNAAASSVVRGPKPRAKNLIFLVVDGMCNGTLALAHHWKLRNYKQQLNWMQLYDRKDLRRSFQETASNSSPVTDSAAAASAWGCGQRVNNGSINTDPDGHPLTPIFARAKQAGKRTGLVTTCRISHATPAGFVANVPNRDMEKKILEQYLSREVDLLLGGGAKHFVRTSEDGTVTDYFKKFEEAGYGIARDLDQLNQLPVNGRPLLGFFSDSHIPYAIDRMNDNSLAAVPGLKDMFKAALKHLDGSEEGFVLQVEGGRVDHAGHANDPGAILHEQLEFDDCIPLALEYIEKHPDTLLIVTTDHGTGGCQLDGHGRRYSDSGPALERMNQFRYSFEWLENRFRATGQFNALPFTLATGITATAEQEAEIQAAINDPHTSYLTSKIARIFADELTSISATGWSSNNHTSENVELLGFGPGSEQLPAFIRNYELFDVMTHALLI